MFKKVKGVLYAIAPLAAFAPLSAHAALPEGVTTALAAIGTDAGTLATTILLAIVAVFAIKFLRRGL